MGLRILIGVARRVLTSLAGMSCELGRRISDRTERAPLHRADIVVNFIDWLCASALTTNPHLTIMALEAFHKDVSPVFCAMSEGMRTNMFWSCQNIFPTCSAAFVTTQMLCRL